MLEKDISPALRAAPPSEIVDLRVEIMSYGVLIPLFILGVLGGLTSRPPLDAANLPRTTVIVAALLLSVACAWLARTRPRLALWLCGLGVLAIGMLVYSAGLDGYTGHALILACAVVALLQGPAAGWVSFALVLGLGVAAAWTPTGAPASVDRLATVAVSAGAAVLLVQVVTRAMFRALDWMRSAFETARQRNEALSEQTARLEQAMKSLSQTSFQLARANEQLAIAIQYAEDARQSKQQFAANVSHELRAPLNLIIGFSDLILRDPTLYHDAQSNLPPKLLADIHVIHRHAQHLLGLVNDILDLSQLDVAYLTIAREPTRVGDLISSALADYTSLVEQRGLVLTVEIEPDLPELPVDRTRIRQVLLNLLNNALRFTDSGGITIRACYPVTSSARHPVTSSPHHPVTSSPRHLVISVSDTGVGIAAPDLQRIFEPFVQVGDPNRRKSAGSGLGLTISKRFVELHGGRMWAESAEGAGSTFHFTLPLVEDMQAIEPHRAHREVKRREVGALLVVERSPVLSRLLSRHLQGLQVASVTSVDQLSSVEAAEAEVVLINQTADTRERARGSLPERLRDVPVFRCYVPGAFALRRPDGDQPGPATYRYLSKPVTHEDLHAMLASMLASMPAAPVTDRGEAAEAAEAAGRPARILIVEDDEDAMYLLGRMVRAVPAEAWGRFSGVTVLKAAGGEQALSLLDELAQPGAQPIDAVLLDLVLGAVSGFDVLAHMERQAGLRDIPVCIVSGQVAGGESLATPYLSLERRSGLTARELARSIAALAQITLPGLEVTAV